MKIVVSVSSFDEALKALNVADVIEFRFDLFEGFNDLFNNLDNLDSFEFEGINKINKPKIVTIRREVDGGKYKGDETLRIEMLKKLSSHADYIDLESDLDDDAFKVKCKIIESYHNFKETPSYEELKNMVESKRGDIFKIATVGNKRDLEKLVKILCNYEDVVAFLMGKDFAFSRILATFLGSPLIYCHYGRAVAEGQINAVDARKILEILGVKE
ncbi:type I 3-dehydroquinate dehydratase [Archaeoglobales archaeon]|nr:MAG: type I 3-dehydroquinate dehydratase [Archaeoglobales archaeon]